MQPIIIIAIVAVGAVAISMGSLGTNIMLNVQEFGVGMEELQTPISDASIDFKISAIGAVDRNGDPAFKNVITDCSFHSFENIPNRASIACKLSKDGAIKAEGVLFLPNGYMASDQEIIRIDLFASGQQGLDANVKEINDVHLVVLGANPTTRIGP